MTWTVVYFDHTGRLGGAERSLVDLTTRLDRSLVRPVVVVGGDGPLTGTLRRSGVAARVLPIDPWISGASRGRPLALLARALRPGPFLSAARGLARVLEEEGASLLHTNSQKAHWIGLLAARLARRPVVWHFRDILEPGLLRWVSRGGSRLTTATIAISGAVRETLCVAGAGARIVVVHNGIAARPARSPRTQGPPRVGMVGQLARWKGPEVFLEAAALVAGSRPDVRFSLVGGVLFPEAEGDYEAVLRRRAVELGVADRVRFEGPVDDAGALMDSFDVLVHPPIRPEPFGRVLVEAMLAGLPVVASTAGAAGEIAVEGETGRIVPDGRPGELAGAVLDLLADPERAAAMGAAGRRRALDRFSIERTVEGVQAVYRSILGSPPVQSPGP